MKNHSLPSISTQNAIAEAVHHSISLVPSLEHDALLYASVGAIIAGEILGCTYELHSGRISFADPGGTFGTSHPHVVCVRSGKRSTMELVDFATPLYGAILGQNEPLWEGTAPTVIWGWSHLLPEFYRFTPDQSQAGLVRRYGGHEQATATAIGYQGLRYYAAREMGVPIETAP